MSVFNLQQSSNMSVFNLQQSSFDLLSINNKNKEVILKITHDGSLFYRKDESSELKKVECDSELALLFISVIADLVGSNFTNKEELYRTIANNYRNGNIDKIFHQ